MPTFCHHFNIKRCTSCSLIEQPHTTQILNKEQRIRNALDFMGSFTIEPTVLSKPQGFRNRIKMAITGTQEHPVIGLTGPPGQLDQGIELLDCLIHHPRLNQLLSALPEFISKAKITPYSIAAKKGELKGIIAFYSPLSHEMYLRFILRSTECLARLKKHLPLLQHHFKDLVCISANIQPIAHAILEGNEEIILTERTSIRHTLENIQLQLTPQAFVQTHAEGATLLYSVASQWVAKARPKKILELYCGQGAFSFFIADRYKEAEEIRGIELNKDAVRMANSLAEELNHKKMHFQAADATQVEEEAIAYNPDLILVNPPRRGLGKGIETITRQLPRHFIYSSCAIETFAIDLQKISSLYRINKIQLFDLFPHTEHFETLVWLELIQQPEK